MSCSPDRLVHSYVEMRRQIAHDKGIPLETLAPDPIWPHIAAKCRRTYTVPRARLDPSPEDTQEKIAVLLEELREGLREITKLAQALLEADQSGRRIENMARPRLDHLGDWTKPAKAKDPPRGPIDQPPREAFPWGKDQ